MRHFEDHMAESSLHVRAGLQINDYIIAELRTNLYHAIHGLVAARLSELLLAVFRS